MVNMSLEPYLNLSVVVDTMDGLATCILIALVIGYFILNFAYK